MIIAKNVEHSQLCTINKFKKHFFKKYGLHIGVSIVDTKIMQELNADFETEMADILYVLNKHIPKNLKKRYPTILYNTRKREIVELRQILMKISREMGRNLIDIAKFMGKKCHSTIIYGANTATNLIETNAQFRDVYNSVIQILKDNHQNNGRIAEFSNDKQDNSQSVDNTALYPGKDTSFRIYPLTSSRSVDMSTIRLDKSTKRVATERINVTY